MQDIDDGFLRNTQLSAEDWWIIAQLQLLIGQVEFALLLGDCLQNSRGFEEIADNIVVLDDVTPSIVPRNNALKICTMRLRELVEYLEDTKTAVNGRQTSSLNRAC